MNRNTLEGLKNHTLNNAVESNNEENFFLMF